MRNWNTKHDRPASLPCAQRFQRTYEELKLPWTDEEIQYLRSSFQRTYEELKRSNRSRSYPERNVFSVPMRNWNVKKYIQETGEIVRFQRTYEELKPRPTKRPAFGRLKFSAYLWGIETEFYGLKKELAVWVFSVPMRNWNSQSPLAVEGFNVVFSVPMRNWNATSSLPNPRLPIVFSVPMRNWNLSSSILHLLRPSPVFSVPMRNWNVSNKGNYRFVSYVFSVPMRNWNQKYVLFHLRLNLSFQRTYEELKPRR